jgi:16S rRNA (cytosine1407-C5)-methyltransferase
MKRKNKAHSKIIDQSVLIADQLQRFQPLLSPAEYLELEKSIGAPLLPAIRLNSLKVNSGFVNALQGRYGWNLTPIVFCPTGLRVDTRQGLGVSETLEYKNGDYYIQEAASMLPVELFNFKVRENSLTLDLAASPGGKTTHLVSRMHDQGLILANDSSQGRIQALKIVLQHWGAVNTAVTRFPGESFGVWFPEIFDRVLIDAPCSMQGLRTTESHPPRPVTGSESRHLAKRQIALLISALQAVSVGGEVVYSTCTLAPEEDEGVVESVLSKLGGSVELLDAQKVFPVPAPGINSNEEINYQGPMEKTIRLWPHRYDTAGFFACLFTKTSSFEIDQKPAPTHSMEKAGFVELSEKEQINFADEFESVYGYPLGTYLIKENRTLIKRDEKIFIFPRLLLERFGALPVQSAGIQLCTNGIEGIVPTFEWVTRFGTQCTKALIHLDEQQRKDWLTGKDFTESTPYTPGHSPINIYLAPDGQFIGRGRVLSGLVKNLDSRRYR